MSVHGVFFFFTLFSRTYPRITYFIFISVLLLCLYSPLFFLSYYLYFFPFFLFFFLPSFFYPSPFIVFPCSIYSRPTSSFSRRLSHPSFFLHLSYFPLTLPLALVEHPLFLFALSPMFRVAIALPIHVLFYPVSHLSPIHLYFFRPLNLLLLRLHALSLPPFQHASYSHSFHPLLIAHPICTSESVKKLLQNMPCLYSYFRSSMCFSCSHHASSCLFFSNLVSALFPYSAVIVYGECTAISRFITTYVNAPEHALSKYFFSLCFSITSASSAAENTRLLHPVRQLFSHNLLVPF